MLGFSRHWTISSGAPCFFRAARNIRVVSSADCFVIGCGEKITASRHFSALMAILTIVTSGLVTGHSPAITPTGLPYCFSSSVIGLVIHVSAVAVAAVYDRRVFGHGIKTGGHRPPLQVEALVLSVGTVAGRLDSVVLNRNLDSHGAFPSVFLAHLC